MKFTVIDNGRPRKRQTIGHLLCSLKNISIENGKQVKLKKKNIHFFRLVVADE